MAELLRQPDPDLETLHERIMAEPGLAQMFNAAMRAMERQTVDPHDGADKAEHAISPEDIPDIVSHMAQLLHADGPEGDEARATARLVEASHSRTYLLNQVEKHIRNNPGQPFEQTAQEVLTEEIAAHVPTDFEP
jgi:hypothetical protein